MRIEKLVDHPHAVALLARWFKAEWPAYYALRTATDVEDDFRAAPLPILLALEGEEPLGTVALRGQALDGFPQLAPGLGGLYVAAAHRGRGVGAALVLEGMRVARELGHREIYAATVHAGGLFVRCGWQAAQTVWHDAQEVTIYRWRNDSAPRRTKS